MRMNLIPYPKYKDSEFRWLGQIPEHWEVKRLKYAAPFRASKLDAKPEGDTYIGLESIESWTGRFLVQAEPEIVESAVSQFQAGDVLFGKLRPYLAKVARPSFDGVSTSEILVLNPVECSQGYLMYFLLNEAYIRWVDKLTYGAKMPRVSPGQVGSSFALLPPVVEQRAIAEFLDGETEKIDALVANKERLIKLLQEKRIALITHAVTKGLNPDVPRKDSGVECLGEIPAHWEARRLKHTVEKIGSGKTPSGGAERYVTDGVLLLRSQNVQFGGLEVADAAYIDAATDNEMPNSRVHEDDILLNITGASLGRCCIARLGGLGANVNQHVCIMRPDQRQIYPTFLALLIESHALQDQIFNNENGVSRDALNFEQVGSLILTKPDISEQRAIAAFLDQETAEIDALVTKVLEAIDRLKELRTALISAAVTGKIDVREACGSIDPALPAPNDK